MGAEKKKAGLLKKLGFVFVGFLGLLAISFVALVVATNNMLAQKVEVECDAIEIPDGDAHAIERGKYLVDSVMGCKICHDQDFGGRAEVDDPMIGKLWGRNLTGGEGSSVGDFTAKDWVRAIRHGVGKDGRRLVLMPSEDYATFGDSDVAAVVAYVKSMPKVNRADEGINLGPLGRFLVAIGEVDFAYNKIDHQAEKTTTPPGPNKEWGKVMAGTCMGCHGHTFSGGKIPGGPPDWPEARNVTQHETGLKGWTKEQFATAVRKGKRPDGTEIRLPMPWQTYAGMSDDDVTALWLYLQTVPPKEYGGR